MARSNLNRRSLQAIARTGLLPKSVWKVLQAQALQSPRAAYWWAKYIIKGPWPEGEPAIARDANRSTYYASNVLHGRFEAGEDAIANSSEWFMEYWLNNLAQQWPEPMNEALRKAQALWGKDPCRGRS